MKKSRTRTKNTEASQDSIHLLVQNKDSLGIAEFRKCLPALVWAHWLSARPTPCPPEGLCLGPPCQLAPQELPGGGGKETQGSFFLLLSALGSILWLQLTLRRFQLPPRWVLAIPPLAASCPRSPTAASPLPTPLPPVACDRSLSH